VTVCVSLTNATTATADPAVKDSGNPSASQTSEITALENQDAMDMAAVIALLKNQQVQLAQQPR